eukprot:1140835-Rhodomonas_salina.1
MEPISATCPVSRRDANTSPQSQSPSYFGISARLGPNACASKPASMHAYRQSSSSCGHSTIISALSAVSCNIFRCARWPSCPVGPGPTPTARRKPSRLGLGGLERSSAYPKKVRAASSEEVVGSVVGSPSKVPLSISNTYSQFPTTVETTVACSWLSTRYGRSSRVASLKLLVATRRFAPGSSLLPSSRSSLGTWRLQSPRHLSGKPEGRGMGQSTSASEALAEPASVHQFDAGININTSDKTPYVWMDVVLGVKM